MEIETLRKSKKKPIIIGGICAIAVLSVGVLATSRAKYKLTESINIANGVVNYKVPDFQIVAMYKSEDGTNYTELEGRMPSSGYVINESKSYCNYNGEKDTNATLKTVDGNHIISNIIKGDKCTIYFDKELAPSEKTLAKLNITAKDTTPDFSQTATTDEGVFKVADGMYGGNSYYWRGAVTNNYVRFAGFCWRIVRINGDGTIRLIYDGTTCHANGTTGEVAVTSQKYNANYNRSEYAGYTYTEGSQRGTTASSNAKIQLESWYSNNITGTNVSKVTQGKFCNDRNTASGYSWSSQPLSSFYYATYKRIYTDIQPTLSCPNDDIYTLNVGLITADEVMYVGGIVGTANKNYYLYNGHSYWTMSPSFWGGDIDICIFHIVSNGYLQSYSVTGTGIGLRPVINLNADVTFSSGNGQKDTPYIVAD